jgi:hypothetical protein
MPESAQRKMIAIISRKALEGIGNAYISMPFCGL